MQLLPGVHLVGSGWLGLSLTHSHDCNVYLVGTTDDALLVDAGCGLGTDLVIDQIERTGIPPSAVRRILLTHSHADHAAGAASLSSALGAEVIASEATARILRRADENAAGLTTARAEGVYPQEVALTPIEVTSLGDRVTIRVGEANMTTASTPGHADGHFCFVHTRGDERLVFTGDLVFSRGRVAVLATPDTDVAMLTASIHRISRLLPDTLLPGHGEPVLTGAQRHLAQACEALDHHRLPEGLLG